MIYIRKYIECCFVPTAWWIKVGQLILHAKRSEPLFSERNGYVNFIEIPCSRWRIRLGKSKRNEI